MSKIICDICGTTYPETADSCPICGCTRDSAAELLGEDLLQEEQPKGKGGRFPSKKKEIFDYDEVNADPDEYDEEEDEEEEDYDEEEEEDDDPRPNTFVIILLTILIAGLLIAAGFIFVRYFLPNITSSDENTEATITEPVQEAPVETTELTIPCDMLINNSGGIAELSAQGQNFLLHITATPEDTTDKIIYTSADESIATVTEDGRITAVSEGETVIYISCGEISLECPVIVKYVEETVPATTEAVIEETAAEEVTEPAPSVDPNVVLKLKKGDISLGIYRQFTLQLDCELEQNQVEWSSDDPHIASVDEEGVITVHKSGVTKVRAKYGDQEVFCWVRCG